MSTLHRHEFAVLTALKDSTKLDLGALLAKTGLGRDEVLWAVENLSQKGMVAVTREGKDEVKLTQEGKEYAGTELPEQSLVKRIGLGSVELGNLSGKKDQIGLVWLKKAGLATIDGKSLRLTEKGKTVLKEGLREDKILKELDRGKDAYKKYKNSEELKGLVKRSLVEVKSREEVKEITITQKGILELAKEKQGEAEEIDALDRSIIKNRGWADKKFRAYNVEAPVEAKEVAIRHPLRSLINEIKQAYVGLGFSEINGPVIEPSFWVFDYLFMPQDHPARDAQDTFFLSNPRELPIENRLLVKRIKEAHENSWHGEWSEKLAMQAVPRTHMTSVTGKKINEIVMKIQQGENSELPRKFFAVGRTFRNENLDFKHLADFYQTDGIVIGKDLTLANLFDILIKFYSSLGINIKFKPAYFPFVEPGVEVYGEWNGNWIELCGAGIIRKEVTGIERKTLNVLAWGGGIERILLVRDKSIRSITELYNGNVGWLRERKIG